MTASLDNFQLRDALLARGFQDITSANRATKSWRLQHPLMRHWVSIKLSEDVQKPMATAPLVVHPDDARKLLLAQSLSQSFTVKGPFSRDSTKYGGVPGHAVSVVDARGIDALVGVLTGTVPGQGAAPSMVAPRLPEPTPLERMDALTTADFAHALQAVLDRMTAEQRAMLLGHAKAPAQRLSMEAIALLGGYENYAAANSQYGRLGHWIADQFSISGLDNWTQALATGNGEKDAQGHFLWTLRPNLLEALRSLQWLDADERPTLEQAAAELDAEGKERSPTTRQTLIDARVGQGLYRERVLDLWHKRCAVTGCTIRSALIASHAKAWKDCTDDARLDPYNGLPLTASIDKLFDKGLIAFADDGALLKKLDFTDADLAHLGLKPGSRLRSDCLHPRHLTYLRAHRAHHGF